MLSRDVSYSEAEANLDQLLDQVYDESNVIVIKRENNKNIALISESELSSLLECVYLLRSPENAKRLFQSLEWAKSSETVSETLEDLKKELKLEP